MQDSNTNITNIVFNSYKDLAVAIDEYEEFMGWSSTEDIPRVSVEFFGTKMVPTIKILANDNFELYGYIADHSIADGIDAMRKITDEYRGKLIDEKKTIRIGDEICFDDTFYGLVLCVDNGLITYLDRKYKTIMHAYMKDHDIKKTGRRFLDNFMESEGSD